MPDNEIPTCPTCGRLLIVHNGITLCPTEDFPATPSKPIMLLGEIVQNPFVGDEHKTIYHRLHDQAHAAKKKEWYGK